MDTNMMLQRQVEVAGALRSPPTTSEALLHTREVIKGLSTFLTQINRLATKLQLPLESVFQCLMQIGLGHMDGVHFDKQARQGNVPMHQAKVLDRNATLNAQKVEPKVREALDEDTLSAHVARCAELRTLLRMKVEDGNDLSMARKLVVLSEEYLDHIFGLAQADGKTMMRLYLADDPEAIHAITGGAQSGGSQSDFSATAGSNAHATKPLPVHLVKGLGEECRGVLENVKAEFSKRQHALVNIKAWLQLVDSAVLEKHYNGVLGALQEPLRAQLGDKRSVICRLACDIVSILMLRVNAHELMQFPKTREALVIWIDVLLKGVHVTVAAIAEATDLTMRDIIVVGRNAAGFLVHVLVPHLSKAAQPELKRKVLNYVMLLIAGDVHQTRLGPHELAPLVPVALKLCASSEEVCRRVARMIIIRSEQLGCSMPTLDVKLERAVAAERQSVFDACSGPTELLEVAALKYTAPCRASTGGWVADEMSSTMMSSKQSSEILTASASCEDESLVSSTARLKAGSADIAPPPAPVVVKSVHPPSEVGQDSRSPHGRSGNVDAPCAASGSTTTQKSQNQSSDRPHSGKSFNTAQTPAAATVKARHGLIGSSSTMVPPSEGALPNIVAARPACSPQLVPSMLKRTSPPNCSTPIAQSASASSSGCANPALPLSLRGLSASTGSVNTNASANNEATTPSAVLSSSLKKRLSQRSMNHSPVQS